MTGSDGRKEGVSAKVREARRHSRQDRPLPGASLRLRNRATMWLS